MKNVAIFSGRFDPPHLGHVMTILDILTKFDMVIVPVLDYPEREVCSCRDACIIFNKIFLGLNKGGKIQIIANNIHFGKITREEYFKTIGIFLLCPEQCVYLSGNNKVLKHFDTLGVPFIKWPRSMDNIYNGKKIRKGLN